MKFFQIFLLAFSFLSANTVFAEAKKTQKSIGTALVVNQVYDLPSKEFKLTGVLAEIPKSANEYVRAVAKIGESQQIGHAILQEPPNNKTIHFYGGKVVVLGKEKDTGNILIRFIDDKRYPLGKEILVRSKSFHNALYFVNEQDLLNAIYAGEGSGKQKIVEDELKMRVNEVMSANQMKGTSRRPLDPCVFSPDLPGCGPVNNSKDSRKRKSLANDGGDGTDPKANAANVENVR